MGQRVLALGDPDYGGEAGETRSSSLYGKLRRLPGTRVEAKAIGDVSLLGADASEAKFVAALSQESRWRAVHFACHGLLNAEQPQLSALALTPDAESDGFLSVHEVAAMQIPADLVVLSACETARARSTAPKASWGSPKRSCSLARRG